MTTDQVEMAREAVAIKFFFDQRVPPHFIAFAEHADIARACETCDGVIDLFHTVIYEQESASLCIPANANVSRDLDLIGDAEMLFVASHKTLTRDWNDVPAGEMADRVWQANLCRVLDISKLSVDPIKIWAFRQQVLQRCEASRAAFHQRFMSRHAMLAKFLATRPLEPAAPLLVTRITYAARAPHLGRFSCLQAVFEAMRPTEHVPYITCPEVAWPKVSSLWQPKTAAAVTTATMEEQQSGGIFALVDASEEHDRRPSSASLLLFPPPDKGRMAKSLLSMDDTHLHLTLFLQPQNTQRAANLNCLLDRWQRALASAGIEFDRTTVVEQGVTATQTFSQLPFNPVLLSHVFVTNTLLADRVLFDPDSWYRPIQTQKSLEVADKETAIVVKFSAGLTVKLSKCSRLQDAESLSWIGKSMAMYRELLETQQSYSELAHQTASDKVRQLCADMARLSDAAALDKKKVPQEIVAQLGSQWGLRQMAPDIFLPKYTRHCYAVPSIVVDSDEVARIKALDDKSCQMMLFPKAGQKGVPRIYTCHYNTNSPVEKKRKFIYPGLMVNPLENKADYPFTPCCFTNDQRNKPGKRASRFQEYYTVGAEVRGPTATTKKPKLLRHAGVKRLPRNVDTLLQAVCRDKDVAFVRLPASDLFECLKMAGRRVDERRDRKAMAKLAVQCAPFNAGCTLAEIRHDILHADPFLPHRFLPAIEAHYAISLFVFEDDDMVLPRDNPVLFNKATEPAICVFLSLSDGIELIGTADGELAMCGPIVVGLEEIRWQMTMPVIVDPVAGTAKPIRPIEPNKVDAIKQCIDASYRCIGLVLRNKKLVILDEPRPPIAHLPIVESRDELAALLGNDDRRRFVHSALVDARKKDRRDLAAGRAETEAAAYALLWQSMRQAKAPWTLPQFTFEVEARPYMALSLPTEDHTRIVVDRKTSSLRAPYLVLKEDKYLLNGIVQLNNMS